MPPFFSSYRANISWFDERRVDLLRIVRSSHCLLEAELALCRTNMDKVIAIAAHLERAQQLIERERQDQASTLNCSGYDWEADIAKAAATLVEWEAKPRILNEE
jgi:hypothetical protein